MAHNPRFRYNLVIYRVYEKHPYSHHSNCCHLQFINDRTGETTIFYPNHWHTDVSIADKILCCHHISWNWENRKISPICWYSGSYQSGDRLKPPFGYRASKHWPYHGISDWDRLPYWFEQEYCTMDTFVSKYQKRKL